MREIGADAEDAVHGEDIAAVRKQAVVERVGKLHSAPSFRGRPSTAIPPFGSNVGASSKSRVRHRRLQSGEESRVRQLSRVHVVARGAEGVDENRKRVAESVDFFVCERMGRAADGEPAVDKMGEPGVVTVLPSAENRTHLFERVEFAGEKRRARADFHRTRLVFRGAALHRIRDPNRAQDEPVVAGARFGRDARPVSWRPR
jgi:hypothetical protein